MELWVGGEMETRNSCTLKFMLNMDACMSMHEIMPKALSDVEPIQYLGKLINAFSTSMNSEVASYSLDLEQ
jgi:hypothetical protein